MAHGFVDTGPELRRIGFKVLDPKPATGHVRVACIDTITGDLEREVEMDRGIRKRRIERLGTLGNCRRLHRRIGGEHAGIGLCGIMLRQRVVRTRARKTVEAGKAEYGCVDLRGSYIYQTKKISNTQTRTP